MESQNKDENDTIQQTELRELPFDLISEMILTRLPIKSVVRFKSVSKLWYSTLSSSRFASVHLKFPNPSTTESLLIQSDDKFQIMSYENGEIDLVNIEVDFDVGHENMILVGTCNGLVCLGSTYSGRLFILWNPITRKFRKYFDEIPNRYTPWFSVYWGFGYLSTVDDYKIVRICNEGHPTSYTAHVYSFRSNKWKIMDINVSPNHNLSVSVAKSLRCSAVLVYETLYWTGLPGLPRTIISFDLASEIFDTFTHFEVTDQDNKCTGKLVFVVNGCLSLYDRLITVVGDFITILKSRGVIDEIILPIELAELMSLKKIIGFRRSYKVFIECLGNQAVPILGVIDLTSQPLKLTPLMTLEATELVSYCATLISPNAHVITHNHARG